MASAVTSAFEGNPLQNSSAGREANFLTAAEAFEVSGRGELSHRRNAVRVCELHLEIVNGQSAQNLDPGPISDRGQLAGFSILCLDGRLRAFFGGSLRGGRARRAAFGGDLSG